MVSDEQSHADWWSIRIRPRGLALVRAEATAVEGHDRVFSDFHPAVKSIKPVAWIADEVIEQMSMTVDKEKTLRSAGKNVFRLGSARSEIPLWDIALHTGALLRVRADVAREGSKWWRFGRIPEIRGDKLQQVAAVQRSCVRSARLAVPVAARTEAPYGDDAVLDLLQDAIDRRDSGALSRALDITVERGVTLEHLWMLSTIYGSSWHSQHENVTKILQELPPAEVASVLLGMIRTYTSVSAFSDSSRWILRSSISTLNAIPGDRATRALARLSEFGPEVVREEAIVALESRAP